MCRLVFPFGTLRRHSYLPRFDCGCPGRSTSVAEPENGVEEGSEGLFASVSLLSDPCVRRSPDGTTRGDFSCGSEQGLTG